MTLLLCSILASDGVGWYSSSVSEEGTGLFRGAGPAEEAGNV